MNSVKYRIRCRIRYRMSMYDVHVTYDIALHIRYRTSTYDIVRQVRYVRYRIQYVHTTSYVLHVRCRTFCLTYDVVYDMLTRCRTSVIRYRTSTYDINMTYDIVPTMSYVAYLYIARTTSYLRCCTRHRTSDVRCRTYRRKTSYVTYDIVGGKNPDVGVRTPRFPVKFNGVTSATKFPARVCLGHGP